MNLDRYDIVEIVKEENVTLRNSTTNCVKVILIVNWKDIVLTKMKTFRLEQWERIKKQGYFYG